MNPPQPGQIRSSSVRLGFTLHARRLVLAGVIAVTGVMTSTAYGVTRTSLQGTVTAAGRPLSDAQVTVYSGPRVSVRELGRATTDASGVFKIAYTRPAAGLTGLSATTKGAAGVTPGATSSWVGIVVGLVALAIPSAAAVVVTEGRRRRALRGRV